MDKFIANIWWCIVTVSTFICVALGTAWILQAAKDKYLIIYRFMNDKQSEPEYKDFSVPRKPVRTLLKQSYPQTRRVRPKPLFSRDPNYVRLNRTRRRVSRLDDVCNLATIGEEYVPFSYFY